jgi:menaquinone-9 beta-reductase
MRTSARYDIVVVGARVAGASTAMLMARTGARVLLLDRSTYGRDTLSTHALQRGGVVQLHRWGLLDRLVAEGTPALRSTTFHYGGEQVRVEMKPADGIDALYAPRRTVLDPLLVDAAVEAGVDVRFGVKVDDVARDPRARVVGVIGHDHSGRRVEIAAELVVGADGVRSRIAEAVSAPVDRVGTARSGAAYAYVTGLDTDGIEWHYGDGLAAGIIPTNDDQVCVFVGAGHDRFRRELHPDVGTGFDRILGSVNPQLQGRVRRATRVGGFRRFPGIVGFLRRASGPGWSLVGDAGYFKDPITAHGITDALRDAELLVRSARTGDLASYQALRDEVALPVFEATDTIARYDWTSSEVREHLLRFSRASQHELALLRRLDATTVTSAGAW